MGVGLLIQAGRQRTNTFDGVLGCRAAGVIQRAIQYT